MLQYSSLLEYFKIKHQNNILHMRSLWYSHFYHHTLIGTATNALTSTIFTTTQLSDMDVTITLTTSTDYPTGTICMFICKTESHLAVCLNSTLYLYMVWLYQIKGIGRINYSFFCEWTKWGFFIKHVCSLFKITMIISWHA